VLKVTSSPYLEWFDAPKDHEQKILHSRLLELSQWDFLKNLLSNGPHVKGDHNKIPNASFFCLQILAFWLSWTRKLYSKDGILNLSKELLNTLLKWKENVVIPEEKELITKLYDDFVRFPPAEDMDGHRVKINNNTLNDTNNNNVDGAEIVEIEEVKDTRTPAEKADEARTNGNELFKKKMYTEAIEAYKQAIRHDNTRAAFYANLAAAWLQLSKQVQKEIRKLKTLRVNDGIQEKDSTMVAHANKCIESCKNAIKRDPTYVKAFHRFGQALDIIGKRDEALAKLKEAKKVLQVEIKSKPPKSALKKLQKLKKSINALQADIEERQEAEERASNGWGINNINVNNNLNKKKGRTDKEATTKDKKNSSPEVKDIDDEDGGHSINNVVDSKVSRIASKLLKRKQFKNV
jgi:tetratricopeptide (TPR) repeat protein